MNTLTTFAKRLPGFGLMLSLLTVSLLSSCSRPGLVNNNGAVSFFGVIYYLLAAVTIVNILKQDWSFLKKVIWTAVVLVPLGLIAYYLFADRKK